MRRVVVVGTTGSGKSTLAAQISERMNGDFIELDALNWLPGWVQADNEEFLRRIDAATQGEKWVAAGNYSRARAFLWPRADTVIWLDYPFHIAFWRLFKRTIQRIITQEDLWGTGNRESWRTQFFTKDSLFLWFFKTYGRRKREYPQLFALPEYAHLTVIRLANPRQTENWLKELNI